MEALQLDANGFLAGGPAEQETMLFAAKEAMQKTPQWPEIAQYYQFLIAPLVSGEQDAWIAPKPMTPGEKEAYYIDAIRRQLACFEQENQQTYRADADAVDRAITQWAEQREEDDRTESGIEFNAEELLQIVMAHCGLPEPEARLYAKQYLILDLARVGVDALAENKEMVVFVDTLAGGDYHAVAQEMVNAAALHHMSETDLTVHLHELVQAAEEEIPPAGRMHLRLNLFLFHTLHQSGVDAHPLTSLSKARMQILSLTNDFEFLTKYLKTTSETCIGQVNEIARLQALLAQQTGTVPTEDNALFRNGISPEAKLWSEIYPPKGTGKREPDGSGLDGP